MKILNNKEDRGSDSCGSQNHISLRKKETCHLVLLFAFYLSSNYVLIFEIFCQKHMHRG